MVTRLFSVNFATGETDKLKFSQRVLKEAGRAIKLL